MTPAEWDKQALELALRNLQKGFDWQAYMLYCTAISRTSQPVDVVPESKADEGMSEVIALFSRYAACKRSNAPENETIKALQEVSDRLDTEQRYELHGKCRKRQNTDCRRCLSG